MDDNLAQLTADVGARIADLGYELVDLRTVGSRTRGRLQIRIDRVDAGQSQGITVDDCAQVSRRLEEWLDQTLALGSHYSLEVSSPGIERPVRWREHWVRFIGRVVNVRVVGRGRFRATIQGVEDDTVRLRPQGEADDVRVPLSDVREATLVVDWNSLRSTGQSLVR